MRVPVGRRSAVVVAILSTALVLTTAGSAVLAKDPPPGLSRFMYAVGEVESGGNYRARNPYSGAYGKYQIMPANWPAWAQRYLGDRHAKQTPSNQEKVAAGKFTSLYRSLGGWKRVAYWWLTGSKRTSGWSAMATRYVARVMRLYERGREGGDDGDGGDPDTPPTVRLHIGDGNAMVRYEGRWRTAGHARYQGDRVHYATSAGAAATLRFSGRTVTWYGPAGPTRGQAQVFIDGKYVRTVDFHRRSFSARIAAFTMSWPSVGAHTMRIEVVGTKGHPMVAIDEFVVTR